MLGWTCPHPPSTRPQENQCKASLCLSVSWASGSEFYFLIELSLADSGATAGVGARLRAAVALPVICPKQMCASSADPPVRGRSDVSTSVGRNFTLLLSAKASYIVALLKHLMLSIVYPPYNVRKETKFQSPTLSYLFPPHTKIILNQFSDVNINLFLHLESDFTFRFHVMFEYFIWTTALCVLFSVAEINLSPLPKSLQGSWTSSNDWRLPIPCLLLFLGLICKVSKAQNRIKWVSQEKTSLFRNHKTMFDIHKRNLDFFVASPLKTSRHEWEFSF